MHADDAVDPAGGRIQRGGGHHRFGELARMHFEAAVLLGLQQPDVARRLHGLDGGIGELADLLGLGRLLAQLVGDFHRSGRSPESVMMNPCPMCVSSMVDDRRLPSVRDRPGQRARIAHRDVRIRSGRSSDTGLAWQPRTRPSARSSGSRMSQAGHRPPRRAITVAGARSALALPAGVRARRCRQRASSSTRVRPPGPAQGVSPRRPGRPARWSSAPSSIGGAGAIVHWRTDCRSRTETLRRGSGTAGPRHRRARS